MLPQLMRGVRNAVQPLNGNAISRLKIRQKCVYGLKDMAAKILKKVKCRIGLWL